MPEKFTKTKIKERVKHIRQEATQALGEDVGPTDAKFILARCIQQLATTLEDTVEYLERKK